jgi:hypothetical protein
MHRFVWDLRYTPPRAAPAFSIAATPGNTARGPFGVWAPPGGYTVRLTAGGQTLTAPLRVRMDPRVKTPPSALDQQFTLSMRIVPVLNRLFVAGAADERARALHAQLLQVYGAVQGADTAPSSALVQQAEALMKDAAEME